jgi:hypothetical protein
VRLEFSFDSIDQLWVDGKFPLKDKRNRKVKAKLSGRSNSTFPPVFEIGDLLCSERPSPPQHAITLMLEYVHSITPAPAVMTDGWSSIPGSPIIGQIRIPLPAKAIAQIRNAGDNVEDYQYELTLDGVELENKTPRRTSLS